MPGEVEGIPGHQGSKASSGPAIRRLSLTDISFVQRKGIFCLFVCFTAALPSPTQMLQGESPVLVQSSSSPLRGELFLQEYVPCAPTASRCGIASGKPGRRGVLSILT